jgi:hypothetical protein
MATEVIEGLVSVVIPAYNRAHILPEAVDSVLAQTYPQVEIIISDDGSTDDTRAWVQGLMERIPGRVRYVRNDNAGPGPAREAGRQLARGEFIQYLDSDDLLLPRKFELQVAALRARPECGVAYGHTRLETMDGKVLVDPFKWTGKERSRLFPALLVDRWWCTHTPLYRRSVTDAAGPWSSLRYSQDWEYDARVGALGTPLVFCDQPVSVHRQHQGKRQTGHGQWLNPDERVMFFSSLWAAASRVGVPAESPEARHFSRWVFHHARDCARQDNETAARKLMDLAITAAVGISRAECIVYRATSRCIGWSRTAAWTDWLRRLKRSDKGPESLPQSWMK